MFAFHVAVLQEVSQPKFCNMFFLSSPDIQSIVVTYILLS